MRYIAYGSNLHPLRLTLRVASARLLGTTHLPGWTLRFHKRSVDDSGKCSIQQGNEGVHAAVFELSGTDKPVLDKIEGLGAGYDEVEIDLPEFGRCFAYAASASHVDDSLRPYDWYQALVLAGARVHDFPLAYVEGLESVRANRDPDDSRHAAMWELVELVEMQGLHLAGERVAAPPE